MKRGIGTALLQQETLSKGEMKNTRINHAQDVAEWRLCIGCGACYWACPEDNIRLFDVIDDGIRPKVNHKGCESCGKCIEVCPGIAIARDEFPIAERDYIESLMTDWGPVLEVWEGYASDPDIRFKGSSGGLATALSLYCLEQGAMHGVLHIGPDNETPWKNRTVLSRSKEDLLRNSGSRYSPASPCEGLSWIEEAPGACVFAGKPCDVIAVRKAAKKSAALSEKLGVTIAIFCAGTPSTRGTFEMLKSVGISPEEVEQLRYRGNGWPGLATIRSSNSPEEPKKLTYRQSWENILQKYRPFRCHLCPDGTGEFADLTCGDPWYRDIPPGEPGRSMLLVRTERGRAIACGAMEKGYIMAQPADPSIVSRSSTLFERKRSAWGRVQTMRWLGIPFPRYRGLHLGKGWLRNSFRDKVRSFYGTYKRIRQRGMTKRRALEWPSQDNTSTGE